MIVGVCDTLVLMITALLPAKLLHAPPPPPPPPGPAVTTGGRTTDIFILNVGLGLPARSVMTISSTAAPTGMAVSTIAYVPSIPIVPVPTTAPLALVMVTVDPTSPVPVIVGVCVGNVAPLSAGDTTGATGAIVSIVTTTGVGVLVLPARSVVVMLRVLSPSGSAGDIVTEYSPLISTEPVPIVFPDPSIIVMMSPGVPPVPVIVGVLSSVTNGPVVTQPIDAGVHTESGAIESIEKVTGVLGLGLPARSVVITLSVLEPSGRETVGVYDQLPDQLTVPVPMRLPDPSVILNTDPGSPVPLMVGVLSDVRDPLIGDVTIGALGGVVSMVTSTITGNHALPARSVVITLSVLEPSGRETVGVYDQLPDQLTVPVPMRLPDPSVILNTDPGSPVPLMVGVLSDVRDPLIGDVTIGALGGVVSMVIVRSDPVVVFPAASVITGVIDVVPSANAESGVHVTVPATTGVGVQVQPVTTTVESFSAENTTSGVVSLVAYGATESPPTEVTPGARGGILSIVKLTTVGALSVPVPVRAVTRIVLAHWRNVGGIIVYDPLPSTVPVTSKNPSPSYIDIVSPAVPVPVIGRGLIVAT